MAANLPNDIDLEKLGMLLFFSDRYEINIQFWPNQIAVYISKGGVELVDFGGDFDFAVTKSIGYLSRLNKSTGKPACFRPGDRFTVKNDVSKEVFTFNCFESPGEIHCYDSVNNHTILENTYLSDLEHC